MTNEDRKAKIAELRAEADRLERERKRNWPEKVEIGMIFQHEDGEIYMVSRAGDDSAAHPTPDCLVCVTDSWPRIGVMYANYSDDPFDGDEAQFAYLGHARDLLTVKAPDAPEPTGAELVGKAVHVCDVVNGVWRTESCGAPIIVVEYNPDSTLPYTVQSGNHWRFARLAKEQP